MDFHKLRRRSGQTRVRRGTASANIEIKSLERLAISGFICSVGAANDARLAVSSPPSASGSFFHSLRSGLRFRSGSRNRSRNRYFHLGSERAFHCHARSCSEAELAMVGANGMPRRAAQQCPVVPQPFACGLPDLCRQCPRGGGRCLAGQLDLEAIDPIGNLAGGFRFRRAGCGSCTGSERDRGKRDSCLVRHTFANLRRRLAALVDRRRHRRLDRCTAGVDRDPELARQD